ncbi:hypothetical protein C0Q70_18153 [Pomacea canaliculata]|uniref:Uncharacterized protein n=1 Tax=Pomacea canaliculata TaxID=400727 RepID=A0A2T7NME9_POMCA|nr:hypothetical protein C0Q70_18153 [Pomacea canaliculata]
MLWHVRELLPGKDAARQSMSAVRFAPRAKLFSDKGTNLTEINVPGPCNKGKKRGKQLPSDADAARVDGCGNGRLQTTRRECRVVVEVGWLVVEAASHRSSSDIFTRASALPPTRCTHRCACVQDWLWRGVRSPPSFSSAPLLPVATRPTVAVLHFCISFHACADPSTSNARHHHSDGGPRKSQGRDKQAAAMFEPEVEYRARALKNEIPQLQPKHYQVAPLFIHFSIMKQSPPLAATHTEEGKKGGALKRTLTRFIRLKDKEHKGVLPSFLSFPAQMKRINE